MALQEYQPYNIIHKKGTENLDADALSRVDQNNQEDDEGELTIDEFRMLQKADPKIALILKSGVTLLFAWVNNRLFYEDKFGKTVPVVPVGLVGKVLTHAHNSAISSGHFGVEKTMGKLRSVGWWSSRKDDVTNWVKHCQECQRFKVRNDIATSTMKPIIATYLGEIWATDIAILPESKHGNKYVLVIMEYLSKWAITAALPSFDANRIKQVSLYEVVLKIGLLKSLISDNGSNYGRSQAAGTS